MLTIRRNYNLFFSFVFILWYSTEIVFNTTLETMMGISVLKISSIINWLVFLLLMVQIVVFQTYRKKELFIIALITIPIVTATVLAEHKSMLSAWMFIVASKNVNFKEIIKTAYVILLVEVPMIIIMCFAGVIDDRIIMRNDRQRFSLGFSHPNQLGLRVFQLIVCHCYLRRDKFRIRDYIYILCAVLFSIYVPNSQTAYICLVILLLLVFLFGWLKEYHGMAMEIYMKGLVIGVFLLNLFSIVLTLVDVKKYPFLVQIDKWMSIRFSTGHRVWLLYGISFFGQKVYITEEERRMAGINRIFFLDNAYANILLRYGIFVFAIFSIGFLFLVKCEGKQKNYMLVIILFVYSLYGVMEAGLYMMTHNIFLLSFADVLYQKTDEVGPMGKRVLIRSRQKKLTGKG